MYAPSRNRTGWSTLLVALTKLLVPLAARAQTGWDGLREPRAVAVMRHALSPGFGDPPGSELDDCNTQRNLDGSGRAQARATGDSFRAHGTEVDRVLTSEWCRCRETADPLDLAEVEEFAPLNSFFADRSTRTAQTRHTQKYLARLPDDTSAVLVTDAVNIAALTGRSAASGEIFVITVASDGTVELPGKIAPARAARRQSSGPENVQAQRRMGSAPFKEAKRGRE